MSSKDAKNPHDPDSPAWQLWENMRSSELLTLTYAADAERYTKLSQAAREKADRYREALDKIAK